MYLILLWLNSAYRSVSSLLDESCINKSEIFIEVNGKFDNSENSISEVKISFFNLRVNVTYDNIFNFITKKITVSNANNKIVNIDSVKYLRTLLTFFICSLKLL